MTDRGRQPCATFMGGPQSEYNWHECPGGCVGLRRFCDNCHRDHHQGGWDICTGDASRRAQDKRPTPDNNETKDSK